MNDGRKSNAGFLALRHAESYACALADEATFRKTSQLPEQPLNPFSLITSLDHFSSPVSFANMTKNFTLFFAVPTICTVK